jgi:hypothetical protein
VRRILTQVRPDVVINPRSDPAFANEVNALIERGIDTAPELQRALHGQFPRVVVNERALSGESQRVWYVYRDGNWVLGGPSD